MPGRRASAGTHSGGALRRRLDELTCAACGTTNALWLSPVRGVVECRECGERASILLDGFDSIGSIDGPDSINLLGPADGSKSAYSLGSLDDFDSCGGDR
ncbi:hypothetical protein IMZ11_16720 [Microtetraspora sp. AC03309]|uniref:hypothetical protein n=1 Tax=Microtetraspora sp. AC03309 TaxID=2779376 RepID=UPI001E3E08E9|nr:hypothetical protein [Microtetraspora sp. AC03309]MCC5577270.1 hypothetical protein [Microtetraspora sp. AC03309]